MPVRCSLVYIVVQMFYSLLILYPIVLSIIKSWSVEVYNYYCWIVHFSLPLCQVGFINLGALLLEVYMFIIVKSSWWSDPFITLKYHLSSMTILSVSLLCLMISTASPALFVWHIFSHFSTYVCLWIKYVSYRQYIVWYNI